MVTQVTTTCIILKNTNSLDAFDVEADLFYLQNHKNGSIYSFI